MSGRVKMLAWLAVVVATPAVVVGSSRAVGERAGISAGTASGADIEFSQGVSWTGKLLVARAAQLGSEVPVPRGSNFNGIRWDQLVAGTDGDIRFLLQFNAACQWLRHSVAEPNDPDAVAVWADLPRWPAMRVSGQGEAFAAAHEEVLSGDTEGDLLGQCVEAHDRQVRAAWERGVEPP